MKVIRIIY